MTWLDKVRWLWRAEQVVDAAKDAAKEDGVDPKNILSSKTFWAALAMGVVGTLQQQGVMAAIPAPYGPAVAALLMVVMRYVSTGPVKLPGT